MTDKLDVLLADGVIDEVLGRLKSGKEANISLVRRGEVVIAAKVYKDRSTRSFKNNAEYKEGRKVRNSRTQRAIDSGGRFGRDAAEQAWKSAEADALYKLVGSGVRVPEPVMFYEGVLLMDLVCDAEGRPAPRLIDVAVERDAAIGIYADLVAQMIAMLCCDLIHGDLSPYNILAAADGPTIIDFPQVVSAVHSSRAEYFFLRDFDNVVRFLAGFDPALAVHASDGRAIWRAYVSRELTPQFVPPPPRRATRGPDRRSRPDGHGPARDDRSGRPKHVNARPPQRPQSLQRPLQSQRPAQPQPPRQSQRPLQPLPPQQFQRPLQPQPQPQPRPQSQRPLQSQRPEQPQSRGRRRRPKRRW
jgi:RIO kinase 1